MNDYYKKLRAEVIDLGAHIGQEMSRMVDSNNNQLNELIQKQQDFELLMKK